VRESPFPHRRGAESAPRDVLLAASLCISDVFLLAQSMLQVG